MQGPNNAGSNQIALALGPPDSLTFTPILDDLMDRTLGKSLLEWLPHRFCRLAFTNEQAGTLSNS